MIDGLADSGHLEIVHALRAKLKLAALKMPGPTEVFGGLVFSHDLIHAIGGDEDTNRNMTRRLLLLLESASIGASESEDAHNRIVKGIIHRYVVEDASFISGNKRTNRIPRFLLNDVVRFWRTMAVDYANKYRPRAGQGWALRNIKLRMSRKLLFVSGFFMCISWALNKTESDDDELMVQELENYLLRWTQRPPLESLAIIVETYASCLTDDIFDSYDSFLALLHDEGKRKLLEQLAPEEAYGDEVFLRARQLAADFDDALIKMLFSTNEKITQLTQKYGVF
jgi:hypothetical protein